MTRTETALMAEYPELAKSVPWTSLATAPTPVERITTIADWLGRDDVWMKRDDRISPIYGGNKVRKYENVLALAQARGAKTLVTMGGLASTQAMATSLFGRALGFKVRCVFFDQPRSSFLRRALQVNAAAGCDMIYGGNIVRAGWRALRTLRADKDAFPITMGAAEPIANIGYVDAMLELKAQVDAGQMPRPDYIVLPTGSSGTLAGLALGAALIDWPTEIIGVRIAERYAVNWATVGYRVWSTARYLVEHAPRISRRQLKPVRWRLHHGAAGRGYGFATPEAIEAVPQMERLIGVGETTYSGKALSGLRALVNAPEAKGKTFLFWHTLSGVVPEAAPESAVPPEFARFFSGKVLV
jgi:D-cysteine desulfhydrase